MEQLSDPGTFEPVVDGLESRDPLAYPGYREALDASGDRAGTDEAVVAGPARIGGHDVELAVFSFAFMGGSMGEVAGERLARAMERAAENRVPFVLQTATGGARMQEGMRALVQMARVVAARIELARAGVPFIAVLGHPTTGGVLASLGALADVTLAVEGATVGFAGPRVARRFTGRPLSASSHTASSARRHGLVDAVVPADEARAGVAGTLAVLAPDEPDDVGSPGAPATNRVDAWTAVEKVRAPGRPRGPALLAGVAEASAPLRGDRAGTPDDGVTAAFARVAGRRAVMIALHHDTPQGPGAYRLARRSLTIAARLRLPVVTLVDTRGANPSEESESGGIAWEIASLFEAMLGAPVPLLSIVTGEGGSGGALAFATADRLVAYDDSVFSVIGPEGAAEILWRDGARAPEAARLLRLTAHDLVDFGIADDLAASPLTVESLRAVIAHNLDLLGAESSEERAAARRARWRAAHL